MRSGLENEAQLKIDPVEETADLLGAVRAYELNASAVQASKTMLQQSLDLLR